MKINGTTIPTVFIIPAIMFVFWLGGLSYTVSGLADEQSEQENKVEIATINVATIKTDMSNIKDTLVRLEKQQREDKKEILDAIREQ